MVALGQKKIKFFYNNYYNFIIINLFIIVFFLKNKIKKSNIRKNENEMAVTGQLLQLSNN